jgi:hypothetical protein
MLKHPSRRPSVSRVQPNAGLSDRLAATRRCALAHLAALPELRVDHPKGPGRRCGLRPRRGARSRDPRANPGSRDARAQREHGSACPATDGDGSRSGVALGPPAFARRDGKSVEARDDCGGRGWVVAVAAATSLPAAHAAQGTTFADRLEARATSSSERGVTASNGASFGAPYGGGKRSRICVRLPADPARRGATRARRRAAVLARTLHTCCTAPAMKQRLFALVEGAGRPLHPRRRGAEQ